MKASKYNSALTRYQQALDTAGEMIAILTAHDSPISDTERGELMTAEYILQALGDSAMWIEKVEPRYVSTAKRHQPKGKRK